MIKLLLLFCITAICVNCTPRSSGSISYKGVIRVDSSKANPFALYGADGISYGLDIYKINDQLLNREVLIRGEVIKHPQRGKLILNPLIKRINFNSE